MLDPMEMGHVTQDKVTQALASIPEYHELFSAAFLGDNEPISSKIFVRH